MDSKKLTINTYDRTASEYTQSFFDDTKDDEPYLNKFFSDVPKASKVLDAGCGPGTFSKIVVDKGFDCYGMDLSEKMIQIAKEKVPSGHFDVMDLTDVKYERGCFRAIIAMYSLIHVSSEDVPAVLKRFFEILDDNGKIFIAVQSGEVEEIRRFGIEGDAFVHFYEADVMKTFLENAGFKVTLQDKVDWLDPNEQKYYKLLFTIAEKAQNEI